MLWEHRRNGSVHDSLFSCPIKTLTKKNTNSIFEFDGLLQFIEKDRLISRKPKGVDSYMTFDACIRFV